MRVERFLNRPSTIYRVTQSEDEVDEYGNPLTDEDDPGTVLCYFAPWAQTQQAEGNVDRATTSDEWLYIVAPGTELSSIDHIDIDGEPGTFEVVGVPTGAWNHLHAAIDYVGARLRRTTR